MAKIVNPHPHDYGSLVKWAVPIREAAAAVFKAWDLVKVDANGRINKHADTVAANATNLAFVNSDSFGNQPMANKAHWPAGRGYQSERGHIVYTFGSDSVVVMSLEGNAPANIETLIGLKRDIAYVAGAIPTVLIKSTSANPRVQILGILEGKNNEANPTLLVRPLLDADNWFGA